MYIKTHLTRVTTLTNKPTTSKINPCKRIIYDRISSLTHHNDAYSAYNQCISLNLAQKQIKINPVKLKIMYKKLNSSLTIRLPREEKNILTKRADDNRLSLSAYLRSQIFTEYVKDVNEKEN